LKPEPIDRALNWLKSLPDPVPWVTLLTPQGTPLRQTRVKEMVQFPRIILICGKYEGIDERIADFFCDEQISIGDYVLTGGELPVMVVVDSICRLIPGVLGNPESLAEESYSEDMALEYPQYTRPADYKGWKVPEVLLSGNHKQIREWRENPPGGRCAAFGSGYRRGRENFGKITHGFT